VSVKNPFPVEDVSFAVRIDANATLIATSLRASEQFQDRQSALAMVAQMEVAGERQIDSMSHDELRAYAKNMQGVVAHLSKMLIQADANRAAMGIHDNETKSKLAGSVKKLGEAARDASSRKRLGADLANAAKREAKDKVRVLWNSLPLRQQVSRGAVQNFATKTAPKVENATFDGIRRWVAEFRKESSNR
jgi:prophage DNA circulation protein